jgi:hypothetical protein
VDLGVCAGARASSIARRGFCDTSENMKKRLLTPLIASLFVVAPLACGGDKSGDTADTASVTDSSTSSPATATEPGTEGTTAATTPTTTGPDETTTSEPPTTTNMTTDPTSATTGEPVGCQAPADDGDEDSDGVLNSADNCRCDANPNQLDFDGNAVGNVCDAPLVFKISDGAPPEFNKLDTTATAKSTLSCSFPVSLIILGGDLEVELDDVGNAKIFALKMNFADTPELVCDLVVVKVKLRIQKWFSDGDMPFAVGFPFTLADHDAGTVTGMTDKPHSILVTGVINVTESSNPDLAMPGENPLMMAPGAFPAALASTNTSGQASLTFDDKDSVVFMQTTMSGIEIKLSGLKGTLRLKK